MKRFWKGLLVGTAVLVMALGVTACKKGGDSSEGGSGNDSTIGTGTGTDTPEVNKLHFGTDPFNGTWNETVPGIGLMLYCDAIDKDGNKIEDITTVGQKVVFKVESGATAAGATVSATSGQQYFYATGAGKATVKVTVTDGEEKIEETKEITVSEVGTDKKFANYTAFGRSVYEGKLNINLDADATAGEPAEIGRGGLVITKSGLFVNRGRSINDKGTIGLIYCEDLGDNFEVTMDVTVHYINTTDVWNALIFKFWMGNKSGEDADAGNWYVNWNGGLSDGKAYMLGSAADGSGVGSATSMAHADRKDKVEVDKTFTLKLSRTVASGQATLKLEYTMNGAAYTTLASITSAASTAAGNAGSKVINVVVQHWFEGEGKGSLEIGNIVRTKK